MLNKIPNKFLKLAPTDLTVASPRLTAAGVTPQFVASSASALPPLVPAETATMLLSPAASIRKLTIKVLAADKTDRPHSKAEALYIASLLSSMTTGAVIPPPPSIFTFEMLVQLSHDASEFSEQLADLLLLEASKLEGSSVLNFCTLLLR